VIHHHLQQVALYGHVSHIVQGRFPYCHNRNNNTQNFIILFTIKLQK